MTLHCLAHKLCISQQWIGWGSYANQRTQAGRGFAAVSIFCASLLHMRGICKLHMLPYLVKLCLGANGVDIDVERRLGIGVVEPQ